eukprot:c12831_g1_i1.p1 GENE.c12831_g1_i1~~c12831_g1_i1.p1  ORF type:complete len:168 (-),score=50.33 c12831_g1_i1:109-612(-)
METLILNEGFFSSEGKKEYEALLEQIHQENASLEENKKTLESLENEYVNLKVELEHEKDGENFIRTEMQKISDDIKYTDSQSQFYDDGIKSLERLYQLCSEKMQKIENDYMTHKFENLCSSLDPNKSEDNPDALLREFEAAKSDLVRVSEEFHRIDDEYRAKVLSKK